MAWFWTLPPRGHHGQPGDDDAAALATYDGRVIFKAFASDVNFGIYELEID